MDLDNQQMSIRQIIWHSTASNPTVEFVLQSREVPPRPDHIREDLWYGGGGETLSVSVPVPKRAAATAPSGIGLVGQDAAGENIYVRYDWNATSKSWTAGPRVDPNTGKPI